MGIEHKYEYLYYTVVDIGDYINTEDFTWGKAIDLIEKKFKESEDPNVRNFRVDGARFCSDIKYWIGRQERHKVRPVFTQFSFDQSIIKTQGQLFELYEEEDVWQSDDEDGPDDDYADIYDGLAGAGGRL